MQLLLSKIQPEHTEQIRKIAYERFSYEYWPSINIALHTYVTTHSVVALAHEHVAGFILVCPPNTPSAEAYGVSDYIITSGVSNAKLLEVAFVAVDPQWEGKGLARRMLSEVLLCCKATHQGCWLHVDSINPKARGLYESIGFRTEYMCNDPYGSYGHLMMYGIKSKSTSTQCKIKSNICKDIIVYVTIT